jgi:uncharacterized protein
VAVFATGGTPVSGAIAIFVKTPGHSAVKTRLALERGRHFAEAWHLLAAQAVASVVREAARRNGLAAYWAVAEAAGEGAWPELPVIAQGEGGLAERMARVQEQLVAQHGSCVLLGADTPQLTVDLINEAHGWLDAPAPRLVLGPARDGGFWLFGANLAPPLADWQSVTYSRHDTADRFRHVLDRHGAWCTLATLADVDHEQDLASVAMALQALAAPTAEQRALAAWMQRHVDRRVEA